ncbi:hypothetical protein [Qipengyuania gelatinilytica]|uniref:Uncharacterized protein n=1 Tax=Qipengyuania gelatinilytica TaxID=2867231 RepID=A0ABX9A7I4_9SPHN|nr:hypothetical protein [Qipengyuania gelatinilytica]QZD96224.1 hypothetical protein K3136_05910 [Qipengyuania gelatinilytica]
MQNEKVYVEPTTVVAIAKFAYAAWQAYQKNRREQEELDLLRSIDRRLGRVLDNQQVILRKLDEMQVFISAELRAHGIDQIRDEVEAYRSNLEVVAKLIPNSPEAALQRVRELEMPTRLLCFELMEKGFSAFLMSVPASILHLAVLDTMRRLGEDAEVIKNLELAYLTQWEQIFSSWLEEGEQQGIVYAANLLKQNRERWSNSIAAYPREHHVGWHKTNSFKTERRSIYRKYIKKWLVIEGSKEDGFSGRGRRGPGKEWRYHGYNDVHPGTHKESDDLGFKASIPIEQTRSLAEVYPWLSGNKHSFDFDGDEAYELERDELANFLSDGAGKAISAMHPALQKLNNLRQHWIDAVSDETEFAEFVAISLKIRQEASERREELEA